MKPHPSLKSNNFSVKIEGLIKFPLSDNYTFFISTDAAVSLEIND
ncbi:MAG: PA14 domain-containing protein [bacterium]